jgi:lipopolysaccharide export system permease protein
MKGRTLSIFLIKTFIPPFILTLFIGLFIFFMIFVFKYLEDVIGKGLETSVIIELFSRAFISSLPIALPLAVLLSSIMTLGKLAESYELIAIKSAGLSLMKILRPLTLFVFLLSIFSFCFSNWMLPNIMLHYGKVLYDVMSTKPAVNLQAGKFYTGIDNFSIKADKKLDDGKTLLDLSIYDHSANNGNTDIYYAKKGKIELLSKDTFMVMTLYDGVRYQNQNESDPSKPTQPFNSMAFKVLKKYFSLSEFKMKNTEASMFKRNEEVLNLKELDIAIDSIKTKHYANTIYEINRSFIFKSTNVETGKDSLKKTMMGPLSMFINNQLNETQRLQVFDEAIKIANNMIANVDKDERKKRHLEDLSTYKVQWHKKISLAISCIVLFFIGAPLGAIIKKGGLGMPVVVSIFLFILFHVLSFSGEKMVKELTLPAHIGMWLGPIIFLPFGIWLTITASKDRNAFDFLNNIQLPTFLKRTKKEKA